METTETNALQGKQMDRPIDRVKRYLLSNEVKESFTQMMGHNAMYYINQVLILIVNSEDLQQCEPKSIFVSALRAASLRLSVDAGNGQAWIIPYNNNKTGKKEAQFQLGYKGVYELAMRTGQYRCINTFEVFEGEEVAEDRFTGMHIIGGNRISNAVIGWMLYFKLRNGFEKTFYMTVEEIANHADHYARANFRNPKSKWNDPVERPKMEKKTVLKNGLKKWGVFNIGDEEIIEQIESETPWLERIPEENEVTQHIEKPISAPQAVADLYGESISAEFKVTETETTQTPAPEEKPWTNKLVTLERAKAERSSTGEYYWDLETPQLSIRFNSLEKVIQKNGLTPEDKTDKLLKRDILKAIIEYRNLA